MPTQSCFVAVYRLHGGESDHVLPDALQRHDATYVGSDPISIRHKGKGNGRTHAARRAAKLGQKLPRWRDWYRVAIPAGRTLLDIARDLCGSGLEGPFWGIGREHQATGQTKKPGSHSEGRHR